MMTIQQRMIQFISKSNWFIFCVVSLLAFINTPRHFALGIFCGGLIVTLNFQALQFTIRRAFKNTSRAATQGRSILSGVIIKYYLRFILSGVMLFLLISKNIVDPLGLIAGLSVVVASFFAATALELTRLIIKEAV
ncbi:MAG: ATP synthase subunit I [Desulfobacterium sp.]|nr:ATP synthase subunit I [Desulfobacterium sp.]